MSSKIIEFPQRGNIILTKAQLAAHLDRSTRWVEMRAREGMPVLEATDRWSRRRYDLCAVEEWLVDQRRRPKAARAERADRLTELERQVAELSAQVKELQARAAVDARARDEPRRPAARTARCRPG